MSVHEVTIWREDSLANLRSLSGQYTRVEKQHLSCSFEHGFPK